MSGDRLHAFATERVEQRLEEERVASGCLVAGVDELGRGFGAEDLAGEERRRVAAECVRPDDARGRVVEDLDDELLVPALARRPRRDEDEQREAVEPALQVGDPAEGGPVGPVQVVDRERSRAPEREVRCEPVEAVQHREGDAGRIAVVFVQLAGLEERRCALGRPVEQLLAYRRCRRREQRLEELAHDAEGEVLLELSAARGQHRETCARGRRAGLGDEARLADAGAALDRDEPSGAAGGSLGVGLHRGELRLPFEQRRPFGSLRRRAPETGAEGRKPVLEAVRDSLEDRLGPVDPRQARLAEAPKVHLGRKLVLDERGARP